MAGRVWWGFCVRGGGGGVCGVCGGAWVQHCRGEASDESGLRGSVESCCFFLLACWRPDRSSRAVEVMHVGAQALACIVCLGVFA